MKTISNNRFELIFGVWSDNINLEGLSKDLQMTCDHIHVAGRPIKSSTKLSNIIAKRHYTGLSKIILPWNDAEVTDWSIKILSKVSTSQSFVGILNKNEIEATLWISVLGDDHRNDPVLLESVIDQAKHLNISILIENYTSFKINPSKTWVLTSSNTSKDVL